MEKTRINSSVTGHILKLFKEYLLSSYSAKCETMNIKTEAPLGVLGIRDICEKNYRDTGYFGEKL